ncbi:transglycosylase SLT domain-containing protein [soil metagenome]
MTATDQPKHLLRLSALLVSTLLAACASTTTPNTYSPPSARNELPRRWVEPSSQVAEPLSLPAADAGNVAAARALLEDTLQPGVQIDPNEAEARENLWLRVRAGFAMPTLDNEGVRRAEAWYAARPDYVERMTERGSRYLFHIIEEVQKRGMPTELALLPFVESAFVTNSTSRAKAAGMWQFMPATGRDFDLKQNIFRDDRRDVLASTRAALDYLGRLNKMFGGDWQLALAAYNWGQGNVMKAIARNEKAGLPTDYDSIKMPDETRYYLPKLQAVKNIVLAPEQFGLRLPAVANHPYFLSVKIERDMDVDVAAKLAGISEESFKQFNPQMNKPVILATHTAQVLLPYDNAEAFATALAAHRGPLATWTAWVVPRTMKPAEAAKQVGMGEDLLREINLIPPKMLVKKGSTLLVPRAAHRVEDVSEQLAENASISLAPDLPPQVKLSRKLLKAGRGETVASVATRYKLSEQQVAKWNKVSVKAGFKAGQQVAIYLPTQPSAKRVVASSKTATGRKPAARSTGGRAVVVAGAPAPKSATLARR